jgi:hypothetical protein
MAIIRTPSREYHLGETLPPIGLSVVEWAWGASPELTKWAQDHLNLPLGTVIVDTIAGHPAVAQVQTHYAYGAHPDAPHVPHKGTSVFSPSAKNDAGRMVALQDVPPGWGQETSVSGPEALTMSALESMVKIQEEKARAAEKKLPAGVTTAGGVGIGLIVGAATGALIPVAIMGGIAGLVVDLWGHAFGDEAAPSSFFVSVWDKGQDPKESPKHLDVCEIHDAHDYDDAANKAAIECFHGAKSAKRISGGKDSPGIFATDTNIRFVLSHTKSK